MLKLFIKKILLTLSCLVAVLWTAKLLSDESLILQITVAFVLVLAFDLLDEKITDSSDRKRKMFKNRTGRKFFALLLTIIGFICTYTSVCGDIGTTLYAALLIIVAIICWGYGALLLITSSPSTDKNSQIEAPRAWQPEEAEEEEEMEEEEEREDEEEIELPMVSLFCDEEEDLSQFNPTQSDLPVDNIHFPSLADLPDFPEPTAPATSKIDLTLDPYGFNEAFAALSALDPKRATGSKDVTAPHSAPKQPKVTKVKLSDGRTLRVKVQAPHTNPAPQPSAAPDNISSGIGDLRKVRLELEASFDSTSENRQ